MNEGLVFQDKLGTNAFMQCGVNKIITCSKAETFLHPFVAHLKFVF